MMIMMIFNIFVKSELVNNELSFGTTDCTLPLSRMIMEKDKCILSVGYENNTLSLQEELCSSLGLWISKPLLRSYSLDVTHRSMDTLSISFEVVAHQLIYFQAFRRSFSNSHPVLVGTHCTGWLHLMQINCLSLLHHFRR